MSEWVVGLTVCDDRRVSRKAAVVCRQLNHNGCQCCSVMKDM